MKQDKKPEVYVKTVLTFGDKPAPAMAQIALRKTMEDGRANYPDAATTLKENSYMDDICDSVSTVEKAHQLTRLGHDPGEWGIPSQRMASQPSQRR